MSGLTDNLRKRPLPWLLAFYVILLCISSLHPFSGWKPLLHWSPEFITAPLPRYITRTDLSTNFLVYLPLGYLLALYLSEPRLRRRAVLMASLGGLLLSLGLESLQQIVPGRISSNLDAFLNTLGCSAGALISLHHQRWLRAARTMQRWRTRWFVQAAWAEAGLWLLVAWLLAQFSLLPFPGAGWLNLHLRPLDTPLSDLAPINLAWLAAVFLEMTTIGAFAACLLRPGRYVNMVVLIFLLAFIMKLLVATLLLKMRVAGGVLSLETLVACILSFWLLLSPVISRHRQAIAISMLLLIILLRALFADYLFLPNVPLLNIVGLAKAAASLWPYLAFLVLIAGNMRHRQRLASPS